MTDARPVANRENFASWCRRATSVELELYIANPAAGFRHFRNYNNLADTNEENELVTLARLEVERRRGRGEFWRWVVTTLVAVAALGASVVSCIDRHPATPRSSAPPVSR